MNRRLDLACGFLSSSGWANANLLPLAGDASARRYFRLQRGGDSAVLMDAPPVNGQDVQPFLDVGEFLSGCGFSAPRVLASDRRLGFILLEDLGDALFAKITEHNPSAEGELYEAATDVLVALDQGLVPAFVPHFNAAAMAEQVEPFFEWYLGDSVRMRQFQAELETVLIDSWGRNNTLLLRDFHAENLIWLPDRHGLHRVGLLDFQDAMAGPPGYDLVSLLQDARRDVSGAVSATMINRFAAGTGRDVEQFMHTLAVVGAQRNLRILGVFARLAQLHGKTRYLEFVPRVWRHAQDCLAHPSLANLAQILEGQLSQPTTEFLKELAKPCR